MASLPRNTKLVRNHRSILSTHGFVEQNGRNATGQPTNLSGEGHPVGCRELQGVVALVVDQQPVRLPLARQPTSSKPRTWGRSQPRLNPVLGHCSTRWGGRAPQRSCRRRTRWSTPTGPSHRSRTPCNRRARRSDPPSSSNGSRSPRQPTTRTLDPSSRWPTGGGRLVDVERPSTQPIQPAGGILKRRLGINCSGLSRQRQTAGRPGKARNPKRFRMS